MGGQKRRDNRSTPASTLLVLLSGSLCSATIYTLDPDGIINPTASPAPVLPPWRWTAEDDAPVSRDPPRHPPPQPPPPPPPRRPPLRRPPAPRQPGPRIPPPRGNTFRASRPTWPPPNSEFPHAWKEALRRAAFQSLRGGAGGLLGYRGITPSIQDDADKELWERLSISEFVGARDNYPGQGGDQPEVSTLAEGLLLHKEGELLFFVSDGVTSCPCENARTLATWSIRRLRHSGPGRDQPQFQLHFSVIPVIDDQQIEIEPDREEPIRHNPSPLYRGIPIFTRNGPKEYNPRFIEEYGSVVSAFLRHRDSLPKYQTIKENKDQNNNRPRQYHQIYDSHDPQQGYSSPEEDEFKIPPRNQYRGPPREEFTVSFTEVYPELPQEKFREPSRQNYPQQNENEQFTPYDPEDGPVEEYHHHYSQTQEQSNSRRQNVRYYRQRYTSYQPHQETRQQYYHHYRDHSASFSGFQQPTQEFKVFKPSTPFERYSELDPLYQNRKPDDHKVFSQVAVPQQEPTSHVSLIPVQAIHRVELPVEDVIRSHWQNDQETLQSQDKQSEKEKKNSSIGPLDWTTINTKTEDVGTQARKNFPHPILQAPKRNSYNETFSTKLNTRSQIGLRTDTYPIGSQSLSAFSRVTEHLSQSFNNEGLSSVKSKFTSWNKRSGSTGDYHIKNAHKYDT
ncbi:uncharacterized protein LOC124167233 [Ischnura elegans]|uniref:uncharacterized protein LOC124167233 n=1 Tax=Ischnura elegans TaxID=197161 RepID=UPI001ED89B47|nr:uncharacterized protein LOC124167233 [Ischnura elegans]